MDGAEGRGDSMQAFDWGTIDLTCKYTNADIVPMVVTT
uniref:Uncharacterized protein n=1 Tax=Setaria italica TaxID=4555 RepID=K3YF74_SETIT